MNLKQLTKVLAWNKSKLNSNEHYVNLFFSNPNHQWIKDNAFLHRAFKILINSLDISHLHLFTVTYPTHFIQCDSLLSCAVGKTGNEQLILIFPDLIKRLSSVNVYQGISVLAHELGHIYHQHTEKKVESLKAQIEADNFALDIGFGEELQEVLLEHSHHLDCRVRISNLTAQLIEIKYKNH